MEPAGGGVIDTTSAFVYIYQVVNIATDTTTIQGFKVDNVRAYTSAGYFSKKVLSATYDPTTKKAINALCDGGIGDKQGGAAVPCATAPQVFIGTSTPKATGAVNTTSISCAPAGTRPAGIVRIVP